MVMIVLAVVFNALFGTKLNTQQIISIAQKQQEIARISKNAKTKATSLAVKNIAVTSETSLLSSQYELTEFMQSKGKKVDQDALTTSQSKTNDDKLATAEATGTYNRTYVELLDEQLQAYQTALQQAYNAADSKSLKTILSNEFKSASTLQAQVAEAQKHL